MKRNGRIQYGVPVTKPTGHLPDEPILDRAVHLQEVQSFAAIFAANVITQIHHNHGFGTSTAKGKVIGVLPNQVQRRIPRNESNRRVDSSFRIIDRRSQLRQWIVSLMTGSSPSIRSSMKNIRAPGRSTFHLKSIHLGDCNRSLFTTLADLKSDHGAGSKIHFPTTLYAIRVNSNTRISFCAIAVGTH